MESWIPGVLACWERGQQLSAVGPGPLHAHLEHARSLANHLAADDTLGLDLGTGAGLPGLALAGFRPDMRWILVDAAKRRIAIVRDAIDALGWTDRVQAIHGRAEDPGIVPARAVDVIVARLFGPPAATAECAAPLLRPGGRLLVTEPPVAVDRIGLDSRGSDGGSNEMRWSPEGLTPLGLAVGRRFDDPLVQELVAVGEPEERFPRKAGVAVRRPLW